jgi:hypothetical protein
MTGRASHDLSSSRAPRSRTASFTIVIGAATIVATSAPTLVQRRASAPVRAAR